MNTNETILHIIKNTPRLQAPVSIGAGVFFFLGCAVFAPLSIAWAVGCFLIYKFNKDGVSDDHHE